MSNASQRKQHRMVADLQSLRKAMAAQELADAQAFEDTRRREERMARDRSEQAFENWLLCLGMNKLDTHQLDAFAHSLALTEAQLHDATQTVQRAAVRTESCQLRHAERCAQAEQSQHVLDELRKRTTQDRLKAEVETLEDRISYAWVNA